MLFVLALLSLLALLVLVLHAYYADAPALTGASEEVLSLLALLVQKYKC